ncbi:MAG: diguanylate cyclase [Acutalibacteraceae bacterium]
MEDCTYHFTTLSASDDICKAYARNTAVIIDGKVASKLTCDEIKRLFENDGDEKPHSAAIILAGQTAPTDWYKDVDQLWLINEENDADTLTAYFERLAAKMKEKADYIKQTICFETLIDSSNDLVWFKDTDGRHLIVNNEFCKFVNKSKQQIYKQGHCYIWDATKEDEKVCLDSDHKIMLGRKTQQFEEQVHTNIGDYIIESYKSALIQDGEVFGTCGIGQNVTKERNLEKKLGTILDNTPFAVAVVSNDGILTYKNKMFDTYFPEAAEYLGKNVAMLKQRLHFPEHVGEGETAEFETQVFDSEPIWFSYCEKKILDAFDSQVEKMVVLQDITANKILEKQKERMANTDYLTGLSNRRGMLQALENDSNGLTVIMVDIDNFKTVNDSLGHLIGDEVLKKFAKVLEKIFVADYIVRYGGDEFLIVTRLKKKENISAKIEEMMREAGNIMYNNDRYKGINVSCGISIGVDAAECTLEQQIEMSDKAMYYIKKHGKFGYKFYDEMNGKM